MNLCIFYYIDLTFYSLVKLIDKLCHENTFYAGIQSKI